MLPTADSTAAAPSTIVALPHVSEAFVRNARRIGLPNVPMRDVPAFLTNRAPLGRSTVGPGDVEQTGIVISAGGPYTGMYSAQTAYKPLLLQVGYPPGGSGTSSLIGPLNLPNNKSCLASGEIYSNPGTASSSTFFVIDFCGGMIAYATPIDDTFMQNYTRLNAAGAPELLSFVFTLDATPTQSSVWYSMIYNYTSAQWELNASKTGISSSGVGFSLWMSQFVAGQCPVTPPVGADSMYLYNGTSHAFEALAPVMNGAGSGQFTSNTNCFKPDSSGPASYTFTVKTPNSAWSVSSNAPWSCTSIPGVSGYYPCDLQQAYSLPITNGNGHTVALVDAYDDPNAESDLATYRSEFGLPACTTANGCFRKVNQSGQQANYPSPNSGWAAEESLDVDMASAVCPNCHILLVEADSNSFADLAASEDTAASLGATEISNSYGGGEFSTETTQDTHFNHPGIAITASTGDSGYGAQYPATSQYVTAVGGTNLSTSGNARGWTESAWSGGGSGCSQYEPKPAWQTDPSCTKRMEADVSAVADPSTGVAVYDTYNASGWQVFGGTSVASPVIAAVYALAGNGASINYGSYPYLHPGYLYDVTTGSNGSCAIAYFCHAEVGYDGPTGLGTPNGSFGLGAFSRPNFGAQLTRRHIAMPPHNALRERVCGSPQPGHFSCYAIRVRS
ncbi:MAG: S53 family peptidase [Candidatus Eremiobacteraeota bacterium]|nr:S53 family peptidase [Candidatus Eremiobacteraeota bacterium]